MLGVQINFFFFFFHRLIKSSLDGNSVICELNTLFIINLTVNQRSRHLCMAEFCKLLMGVVHPHPQGKTQI